MSKKKRAKAERLEKYAALCKRSLITSLKTGIEQDAATCQSVKPLTAEERAQVEKSRDELAKHIAVLVARAIYKARKDAKLGEESQGDR